MTKKLMLVDGLSLIYRAFHALPLLDDGVGTYTNAVYGFFSMLFKVLAEEKPEYVAVAFDLYGPTFRHSSYADYKAGRAPMPEELVPQVPLIRDLVEKMGIRILCLESYEADDILGTLSLQCEGQGIDALLVTGDRDAFQLAGPHTSILYTKRGITDTERITPETIDEKYGLRPEQLIDVKGLMGDKSDNIPGIPGVGEKTAVKLIVEYETLERALDSAETDQKGKLRERLLEHRDQAILSKKLATIDRHVPLDVSIESLTPGDATAARPALEALKLRTLLSRFDQLFSRDGATAQPATPEKGAMSFSPLMTIDSAEALTERSMALADEAPDGVALAFGRDFTLATTGSAQIAVPLGGDLITQGMTEDEALRACAPLLMTASEKTVHDIKTLSRALEQAEIELNGPVHDVMLAAYCLNPQRKSFALGALLAEEGLDADGVLAAEALKLASAQKVSLREDGVDTLYRDIELPLATVLRDMERIGFLVDDGELSRLGTDYAGHIESLSSQIHELAGKPININSPKQLGELLFDELGLPGGRKTKSGYSTGADVLEAISDEHPIIPLILEYRKYTKLMSTYIDALLRLRGADGRIRSSFDQVATATGRISSNEPNLQNIPVRTEMGREIRKAFIAQPGWLLIDADYSQIELRVLAHMSGDEVMTDAFLRDQDIHRRTAAEVYGVPLEEVTGAMRSAAKAVNFGIVYGISDYGLARNIGVSRKEASEFIERYLARYPGIKRFMDDKVAEGKTRGYVETLFGRRRYLKELSDKNYNIRSFGERAAMNSPIQGTAADIIKLSMVRVHRSLREGGYRARLILQVHDELIIESPIDEIDPVKALLRDCMENVIQLSVPLKTDLSVGENWNACK